MAVGPGRSGVCATNNNSYDKLVAKSSKIATTDCITTHQIALHLTKGETRGEN